MVLPTGQGVRSRVSRLTGSESQRATVTAEFTELSVEVVKKLRLRGYERAH